MEKKLPINGNIQYMKKDYLYFNVKGSIEIKKPLDAYEMKALIEMFRKPYIKINVGKPILDEKEKEYLSSVIKPFRNKVTYIEKNCVSNKEYLLIVLSGNETIALPWFEKNTMYKNMKEDKNYTLKELDL